MERPKNDKEIKLTVYFQVIFDKIDPCWQHLTLFKAIWFRQEYTCCIPFIFNKESVTWQRKPVRKARECGWRWFIFAITNWWLLPASKSVRTFSTLVIKTYFLYMNPIGTIFKATSATNFNNGVGKTTLLLSATFRTKQYIRSRKFYYTFTEILIT